MSAKHGLFLVFTQYPMHKHHIHIMLGHSQRLGPLFLSPASTSSSHTLLMALYAVSVQQ